MELDDLKYVFFEHTSKPVSAANNADIAKMIKRKSASPIVVLKRNLNMELIMTFLFALFPVYMLIAYTGRYISALAIFFLVVAVFFIFSIFQIQKSIRRFESSSNAIRQHLKLLVSILQRFSSLYIQSTVLLVPVFFWAAALLVYMDNRQLDPLLFTAPDFPFALSVYFLISVAWSIAMYFFTKWYVKRLYGRHINQLKIYLAEMQ